VPPVEDGASAVERLLAIKTLPLFADLHADDLAVLAERARVYGFQPGETLFSSASGPLSSIHLVLEGRVTEHRDGQPFRSHGVRQVLGGVDVLADTGAEVIAIADEPTRTVAIDRDDLRDILEDNFAILSVALQGAAAATLRLRRRLLPSAGFPEPVAAGCTEPDAASLHDLGARIAFLRRTSLQRARIRTLGQLARDAELRQVRTGTTLWVAGHSADHTLVVVRGVVECATADGVQRFALGPETVVGLEDTLALAPRWFTARAHGEVTLLQLSGAAIIDALEDDSDLALDALAALAAVASALRDRVAHESGPTP
jgi:CRP-like cAMP-binding protein